MEPAGGVQGRGTGSVKSRSKTQEAQGQVAGDGGYAGKSEAGTTPWRLELPRLEIVVLTAGVGHSLASVSSRSGLWRGGLLWATDGRFLSESRRHHAEQAVLA